MIQKDFIFKSDDDTDIFVYNWLPEEGVEIKGIVQISHGMAETAARYERFAESLTSNGYIVYANDHRGHGKTAKTIENLGHLADEDGFNWLVKDIHKLTHIIKEENPSLPLVLFGHSMGSFVAQKYIMLYGNDLDGVILSGSNGKQGIILKIGTIFAKRQIKKNGRKAKSPFLDNMSFGGFNKSFKPNRTDFDWLSRDNAEVDKYIDDPFCGTVFTAGYFYDFLTGLKEIEEEENIKKVPKDLPLYIFSGDKDPVGNFGKGVMNLVDRYENHGMKNLSYKLYEGGRHEMLNETNRGEVMEDVINWLNAHVYDIIN